MGKILVLCIDRDNDLYEKAKVRGPVIGREQNIKAALALSLADPEDADANAIYYAVKMHDKLKKEGKEVVVATLTGDKRLGYKADRIISEQLDALLNSEEIESCILVTDGVADEEVYPIIKSRIKIDSTKVVIVKQAKELEKTYFVLLEKLKDPYFARILIGVPAILILLLSLASYFGLGLEIIGIIIGLYLLMRLFAVDERIEEIIEEFRFSFAKSSWITYVGATAIIALGVLIAFQTYEQSALLDIEKKIALTIGSVIWLLFTAVFIILIGKSIDAIKERKKYKISKYFLYGSAAFLTAAVVWTGSQWVANIYEPYIDFGMFLLSLLIASAAGYFSHSAAQWIKKKALSEMGIEGKEVINEEGEYIGKVESIEEDFVKIKGKFGKRIKLEWEKVEQVEGEKLIVEAKAY